MKRILVTGGGGYVGSVLVEKLLRHGYFVRVLDLFIYDKDPFREIDDALTKRLEIYKGDIRDWKLHDFVMDSIDCVIHLACISNDPSFDLNPEIGRSINLDAFIPLVKAARDAGVRRFINASSSSVYGVSDEPDVTEKTPCYPLTDYSKYKLETEGLLHQFNSYDFTTVSVRSATVCGYSPRQRLDVIVNIFANHAYSKGVLTIHGGDQLRPNVHIGDLTDFYVNLVEAQASLIDDEVFNFGGPNYKVRELAIMVKEAFKPMPVEIINLPTIDPRSYRISSDKAARILGIKAKRHIVEAVQDLISAFENDKLPRSMTDSRYFNIQRIQEIWGKKDAAVAEL